MLGRGNAVPERLNLGYFDWTIECWFRATGPQDQEATFFELKNETDYPRGLPAENSLRLMPGREAFVLTSRTTTPPPGETRAIGDPGTTYAITVRIATDPARLGDGAWHHLAFTYAAGERQMRHYVDGRLQPLPEAGGFLPMLGRLTEFSFGANLQGLLDEYRVSDVVRYHGPFPPPGSFSRNYGAEPRPPNKPNGPPLLFAAGARAAEPVPLGSRKHVLIDGALVEDATNLAFVPQPPQSWQETDFRNTKPWEATPRFGSTIPDISTIWDEGDELRMLYTNGGMWGGKPHVSCLAVSIDGVRWEKPVLNLHAWDGTLATNIVIPDAGQGALIKDTNPAAAPDERYKLLMWSYYRGYYLYISPDGVHFRRNETVGLPFDTDGSTTFFWDDQRGIYHAYFRCVSQDRSIHRRAGHAEIRDIFKPWPFQPVARPWIDDLVLARPALGELPIIETNGQVYRFKAHKYAWAPDVYLAFPWRYIGGTENVRPGSFLMVSRDGSNWTRYEEPYYFPGGGDYQGRTVMEALMEHGMVRRGAELWQFGTVRFTEHGGAIYGGVEHEGGTHDRLLRLVQRLDGFVAAMPADAREGAVLVTRPLTFTGEVLELNVDASGGSARVELQDADGRALPGFALADCPPIRENGTRVAVAWKAKPDLGALAGRPVRLKIELNDARLFAFQFR